MTATAPPAAAGAPGGGRAPSPALVVPQAVAKLVARLELDNKRLRSQLNRVKEENAVLRSEVVQLRTELRGANAHHHPQLLSVPTAWSNKQKTRPDHLVDTVEEADMAVETRSRSISSPISPSASARRQRISEAVFRPLSPYQDSASSESSASSSQHTGPKDGSDDGSPTKSDAPHAKTNASSLAVDEDMTLDENRKQGKTTWQPRHKRAKSALIGRSETMRGPLRSFRTASRKPAAPPRAQSPLLYSRGADGKVPVSTRGPKPDPKPFLTPMPQIRSPPTRERSATTSNLHRDPFISVGRRSPVPRRTPTTPTTTTANAEAEARIQRARARMRQQKAATLRPGDLSSATFTALKKRVAEHSTGSSITLSITPAAVGSPQSDAGALLGSRVGLRGRRSPLPLSIAADSDQGGGGDSGSDTSNPDLSSQGSSASGVSFHLPGGGLTEIRGSARITSKADVTRADAPAAPLSPDSRKRAFHFRSKSYASGVLPRAVSTSRRRAFTVAVRESNIKRVLQMIKGCPQLAELSMPYDDDSARASIHGRGLALHLAAWFGHAELIQQLLETSAHIPDALDSEGFTALCRACGAGHDACVQALLADGADINFQHAATGETPLMFALTSTAHGAAAATIPRLLRDDDLDLDATDASGCTALVRAVDVFDARNDSLLVLVKAIRPGRLATWIEQEDASQRTALHHAQQKRSSVRARVLRALCAPLNPLELVREAGSSGAGLPIPFVAWSFVHLTAWAVVTFDPNDPILFALCQLFLRAEGGGGTGTSAAATIAGAAPGAGSLRVTAERLAGMSRRELEVLLMSSEKAPGVPLTPLEARDAGHRVFTALRQARTSRWS